VKVRIYGEGGHGTDAVVTTDDGQVIENVYAATIRMEAGQPTRVELELVATPVKITGTAEIELMCPYCGMREEHDCDSRDLAGRAGGIRDRTDRD